jgi:hypothetical protein
VLSAYIRTFESFKKVLIFYHYMVFGGRPRRFAYRFSFSSAPSHKPKIGPDGQKSAGALRVTLHCRFHGRGFFQKKLIRLSDSWQLLYVKL